MTTIETTTKGNKQTLEIDSEPGGFNVIVHPQGVRVDIPTFTEINSRNSIECMEKMTQAQWEWISTGDTFRILFDLSFDPDDKLEIPETIKELVEGDPGVTHVCGMIVLGCEAFFDGLSVFVRNPENGCHPKTERYLVTMFKAMMRLCGQTGTVTTAEKSDKKAKSDTPYSDDAINKSLEKIQAKGKKDAKGETTEDAEKRVTLLWLASKAKEKGEDHPLAKIDENVYTVKQLIANVKEGTSLGHKVTEAYLNSYRPKGKTDEKNDGNNEKPGD